MLPVLMQRLGDLLLVHSWASVRDSEEEHGLILFIPMNKVDAKFDMPLFTKLLARQTQRYVYSSVQTVTAKLDMPLLTKLLA